MPKRRYERREPTNDWQQLRLLLKDTTQINYEMIRPVLLWSQTPKERGAEIGMSPRTIYYQANLFDQSGNARVPSGSENRVKAQRHRTISSELDDVGGTRASLHPRSQSWSH